ncbi:MAG: hypothetical protein SPK55_10155 [Succinivibrio sp.]|jgi:hypothetical protein|nr:hypothetical protein [Succinivibrio sp.]
MSAYTKRIFLILIAVIVVSTFASIKIAHGRDLTAHATQQAVATCVEDKYESNLNHKDRL